MTHLSSSTQRRRGREHVPPAALTMIPHSLPLSPSSGSHQGSHDLMMRDRFDYSYSADKPPDRTVVSPAAKRTQTKTHIHIQQYWLSDMNMQMDDKISIYVKKTNIGMVTHITEKYITGTAFQYSPISSCFRFYPNTALVYFHIIRRVLEITIIITTHYVEFVWLSIWLILMSYCKSHPAWKILDVVSWCKHSCMGADLSSSFIKN